MTFTPETWKQQAQQKLQQAGGWLRQRTTQDAPYVLYGWLSGMSLWPLVQTAQSGELLPAVMALGSVASGVGGSLLANQVQKMVDRPDEVEEDDLVAWIIKNVPSNTDLREALDAILERMEAIPQAQAGLSDEDRRWFSESLRAELDKLGNLPRFETVLVGDGILVQGDNATVAQQAIRDSKFEGDVFGPGSTKQETHYHGPKSTDPKLLREAYLNRLLERCSHLSLTGIDPRAASGQSEARLELSAVYTALLTTSRDVTVQLDRAGGDASQMNLAYDRVGGSPDELYSALKQLDRHNRLVLLGDPGSGKSTFVDFVTMCLAGDLLDHPTINLRLLTAPLPDDEGQNQDKRQPWRHGVLLPVPVILRDFAARGLPPPGETATAQHLWRFIASELKRATLRAYARPLGELLHQEGGLLLLDGLDEVPEADRRRVQIKQAVEDFARTFKRCRILVTSRTYAYQRQDWRLPGFRETVLAPFSQGQIRRFVDHWYSHMAALRGLNPDDAQGRAELLKRAIFGSDRLRSLAERPLLLTLMASLHAWRGGSLPEKREELYADTVDLLLDWWESPKVVRGQGGQIEVRQRSLAEWLKVDRDKVREQLNGLAYQAHAGQPELTGTADVSEGDLVSGLMRLSQNPDVNPVRLVEYLRDRAGLLVARGVGVYTFPHRTFQEYLAACHLTDTDYPELVAELARQEVNRWREVALLAGAKAARGTSSAIWQLVDALCYREAGAGSEPADLWGALLAGQALTETANLQQVSDRNRAKVDRVRQWLVTIIEGDQLPATERVLAGVALAQLGDPRPGVGLLANGLPDIEWCDVPVGEFLYGDDERPIELPGFKISKYPITNAQYRAFVEDGGYSERWRHCWTEAGWENKGDWQEPYKFGGAFDLPNHPVVGVSWYEAVAFCRWLTERLGDVANEPAENDSLGEIFHLIDSESWQISLPTEQQWEKAARGTDGREYPWGEQADPDKANYNETGIGTTSAVGCFPRGKSPYGCLDMSGNVDEWCRSKYDEPEDHDLEGDAARVVRGGAFVNSGRFVRCAFRFQYNPDYRDGNRGFRVVLSPFTSDI